MAKAEDSVPPGKPAEGESATRRPRLRKCPHCGRLVTPEPADAAAPAVRCPSCGLEIKERHLA